MEGQTARLDLPAADHGLARRQLRGCLAGQGGVVRRSNKIGHAVEGSVAAGGQQEAAVLVPADVHTDIFHCPQVLHCQALILGKAFRQGHRGLGVEGLLLVLSIAHFDLKIGGVLGIDNLTGTQVQGKGTRNHHHHHGR